MILITTINATECGWEILKIGTKIECQEQLDKMIQNKLDIYDDTRVKNSKIVTNKDAKTYFGGSKNLDLAIEFFYDTLREEEEWKKLDNDRFVKECEVLDKEIEKSY